MGEALGREGKPGRLWEPGQTCRVGAGRQSLLGQGWPGAGRSAGLLSRSPQRQKLAQGLGGRMELSPATEQRKPFVLGPQLVTQLPLTHPQNRYAA